jgi:antitoxin ParD1/3/4/toxin ParE1/3/4
LTASKFVLSPEARDDLDEIWLYISRESVEAADQVEAELRTAIRVLGERPGIGHRRPDLTERPVKFWPVYSYLIVYYPAKRPVEIVRVLHGARDARRLL